MKKVAIFCALTLFFFAILAIFVPGPQEKSALSPIVTSTLGVSTKPLDQEILFVSNKSGNEDIYSMDLTTKKITQLTTDSSDEMNPQLAPDRTHIVYYSDKDGDNEIYEMDLNNKKVLQLTKNKIEDYDPTYSPDGKSVLYKSAQDDQKGDIFIMKRNGSNQKNLTPNRSKTEDWDPVMSQTGEIFFVSRINSNHLTDEIYFLTDENGELKQLTDNGYPDWYPEVSPLGNLIYISKAKASFDDDIYLMKVSTGDRFRLTTQAGNDADPAWSSTGDKIIYINDEDGDYDLYLMNADGTNSEKLIDTPDNELSPIFL